MRRVTIREFVSGASFVTKPWLDVWVGMVIISEFLGGASFVTKPVAGCMGEVGYD